MAIKTSHSLLTTMSSYAIASVALNGLFTIFSGWPSVMIAKIFALYDYSASKNAETIILHA